MAESGDAANCAGGERKAGAGASWFFKSASYGGSRSCAAAAADLLVGGLAVTAEQELGRYHDGCYRRA